VPFQASASEYGATQALPALQLLPENGDFDVEEGQMQYMNPDMYDEDSEAGALHSPPRNSQLHRTYTAASPEQPQLAGGHVGAALDGSVDTVGTPPLGPLGWNGGDPPGDRQALRRQIQRRQSSIGIYKSFAEIKDW
jgi:hypothetical protein